MAIDAESGTTPAVLVGTATEDWSGDARFHEYSTAADPLASGAISRVPIREFPPSVHDVAGSRILPLDLSHELGVPYPATSPALLAAVVVLDPGIPLSTGPDATSELYLCLEGTGQSTFTRDPGPGDLPGSAASHGTIDWADGDLVTLPAGCSTEHRARGDGRALLYRVTDAPLLSYLGVRPGPARFAPTRYPAAVSRARLAEVESDPAAATRSRSIPASSSCLRSATAAPPRSARGCVGSSTIRHRCSLSTADDRYVAGAFSTSSSEACHVRASFVPGASRARTSGIRDSVSTRWARARSPTRRTRRRPSSTRTSGMSASDPR